MIEPKSINSVVGDYLNITCKEAHNVIWFYENNYDHPISYPIKFGPKHFINDAKFKDSGTYFCYGKYTHNDSYFLSQTAVKIYGKVMTVHTVQLPKSIKQ